MHFMKRFWPSIILFSHVVLADSSSILALRPVSTLSELKGSYQFTGRRCLEADSPNSAGLLLASRPTNLDLVMEFDSNRATIVSRSFLFNGYRDDQCTCTIESAVALTNGALERTTSSAKCKTTGQYDGPSCNKIKDYYSGRRVLRPYFSHEFLYLEQLGGDFRSVCRSSEREFSVYSRISELKLPDISRPQRSATDDQISAFLKSGPKTKAEESFYPVTLHSYARLLLTEGRVNDAVPLVGKLLQLAPKNKEYQQLDQFIKSQMAAEANVIVAREAYFQHGIKDCEQDAGNHCLLAAANLLTGENSAGASPAMALPILEKTCTAKDAIGCAIAAAMTYQGIGTKVSKEKALGLLEQGCKRENADACLSLEALKGGHEIFPVWSPLLRYTESGSAPKRTVRAPIAFTSREKPTILTQKPNIDALLNNQCSIRSSYSGVPDIADNSLLCSESCPEHGYLLSATAPNSEKVQILSVIGPAQAAAQELKEVVNLEIPVLIDPSDTSVALFLVTKLIYPQTSSSPLCSTIDNLGWNDPPYRCHFFTGRRRKIPARAARLRRTGALHGYLLSGGQRL